MILFFSSVGVWRSLCGFWCTSCRSWYIYILIHVNTVYIYIIRERERERDRKKNAWTCNFGQLQHPRKKIMSHPLLSRRKACSPACGSLALSAPWAMFQDVSGIEVKSALIPRPGFLWCAQFFFVEGPKFCLIISNLQTRCSICNSGVSGGWFFPRCFPSVAQELDVWGANMLHPHL